MDGPTPPLLSRRSMAMVALFGAALFLIDFGPGWALTYHEAFFAVPAREMLRTGDWIVPRVVGVPAWQKPPLTHWMIAATMGLLRTEAEWAVRLPTLICTILNALFVAALAARWHGDRVGRLAGLIQLTTFYVLFQGRLAECDMPLCAATSGAMLALAVGTIDRDRCGWGPRLAFFALAGAGSLIKGPFALGLIGGAAGLYALIERRRAVWRFLLDPVGWAVMLVLALVWPIAAYHADPSFLVALRVHNLDRFNGVYDGRKDPFFYLYIIPSILLPWTPAALGGLVAIVRDAGRPRALWRLMGCWMLVGMAILSASAWKHKHYPIPVLPPLSIAAAYGLDRYMREARRAGRSPAAIFALVLAIGGGAAAATFAARGQTLYALVASFLLIAGVGLFLAYRLRLSGRPDGSLACLFGTVGLVVVLNQSLVMPRFDLYREPAALAGRTNARFPEGTVLHQVGVPNPQISFYLRWPLRRFDDWKQFARALDREGGSGEMALVAPAATVAELKGLGRVEVLDAARSKYNLKALLFRPDPARVAGRLGESAGTAHR